MILYTKPKYDSTKVVTRFAWFPKTMSNGTIIWLERYTTEYVYVMASRNNMNRFDEWHRIAGSITQFEVKDMN